MEHRWGTRKPVSLHVRLRTAGGITAVGKLCDISVSGAFITTAASTKLHEQVKLSVYGGPQHKTLLGSFEAHVVRRSGHEGIGIEWSELAPQSLRLLEKQGASDLQYEVAHESHVHTKTAALAPHESGLRRRGSRLR